MVRTRIDGFGVSEPVVQKPGNDRIIVEHPGHRDPERATAGRAQKSGVPRVPDHRQDAGARTRAAAPRCDRAGTAPRPRRHRDAGAQTGRRRRSAARSATRHPVRHRARRLRRPTPRRPRQRWHRRRVLEPAPAGQRCPASIYVEDRRRSDARAVTSPTRPCSAALPPGQGRSSGAPTRSRSRNAWYRSLYVLDAPPIITGEYLTDARPNTSPLEGTIVEFTLNNEGGRRFRSETAQARRATTWRSCSTIA